MEQEEYLASRVNRIKKTRDDIIALGDVDDMMTEVLDIFNKTDVVPDVGRYYTFVYKPETPNIRYDEHPLVAVTGIYQWGFRGLNFHWGTERNYNWMGIVGNLHIIYPLELSDARDIPFQKFRINR